MRILTLNIRHGGGKRVDRIVGFIRELDPDVLVLTEYRANVNSLPLQTALFEHGYKWQASSSNDPRQNSVFLASRTSFHPEIGHSDLGKHAHRLIVASFEALNLVGVYFPQNEEKRAVFDYLNNRLLDSLGATMVIGDFNTGRPYLDEVGRTFACIDCFEALEKTSGLVDSWRSRNPDAREFSWYSKSGNGFRIDHVFCTPALDQRIRQIRYAHETRNDSVTDHSAMVVDLDDSTGTGV
jgi:exodeoxyribonuclease III